ncbi:SWI/SNF and RSC complex subunit Ssr3 [Vermiconidia calcicola]|uniref:SWI/SNF and RSC complex subunit Ssr3 n=1 Tax=Vermiconidia calcicola TaxID=1690605 RepID=A0ACC3NSV0_9PEZI|nr:SWI/SNF and RSC complex subunit Ssr3 [Vermiconidia calcicola]
MEQSRGHKRKISFADLEATFRRAGPIQHGQPQAQAQQAQPAMSAQQMEQVRLEQTRRADLARRQSRKPTDREVPDEVADVIVGDGVDRYKKLRDGERRLDAVMMRKRLDISDNLQRQYTRREGILRVWVSNTADGQPWQVAEDGGVGFGEDGTFDFGENSQATFRVKIEGRLLPDSTCEKDSTEEEKAEDKTRRPRLSHFFKSITIDFDRNPALQPDGYSSIEWRKPMPGSQNYDPNGSEVSFDTLEFERKSDENINVTINLVRDVKTERFKLSPLLAEILDTEEEDRAGAVQGIWEYCRAMGLQEDEDRRSIVCDEPLRKLFQKDSVYFPHVPDLLFQHLQALPPIQLSYTIRVDPAYINGSTSSPSSPPSAPTIYDIHVPLPNPVIADLTKFHTSRAHITDLQTLIRTDDDLALLVQKIHQTNAKRKFYDNLSKDPASFVKRWFSSQMRDQDVIFAESTRGGGEDAPGDMFRRGGKEGLWDTRQAHESVGLWLARNAKAA